MGREIATHRFSAEDFTRFHARLHAETALLASWFDAARFADTHPVGGFELEAWLVDAAARPAPINQAFLARLAQPLVVPELARFNVEINTAPRVLRGDALRRLHADLDLTWRRCNEAAAGLGARLVMIGILPTVRDEQLTVANMSDQERYRALNDQVFRLRHGRPITLDIAGRERLQTAHRDVMLEAATTSFQIHIQVRPAHAVRYYNAAQIVAAPVVAACANSPYLFGRALWEETRIPLFEQSVNTCDEAAAVCPPPRVTFGAGYVRHSLLELFRENLERYPVLLPVHEDRPATELNHLRLHNGTIWRWNRPLVGFGADGGAHLRVEHRVVPAGPTVIDTIANAALFFGLVHGLAHAQPAPEAELSFDAARSNFYAAARHGLDAVLAWPGHDRMPAQRLLLERLIPLARAGLRALGLDAPDVDEMLGVIRARVSSACTGAAWQRAYVARHGADMQALTTAYLARQAGGRPVHEWEV